MPEFFKESVDFIKNEQKYKEHDIKLEHYIVSTGIAQMIHGSKIAKYVDEIWGCEFIESKNQEGINEISEVVYTIDNTTKTRAIFEINKGVGHRDGVDVNTKLDHELRRVPFRNMIYIADGPSDIPAFSLINSMGGYTFAVYKKDDIRSFKQAESLRDDGRVNMYGEANYTKDSLAYLWINSKLQKIADQIVTFEKAKLAKHLTPTPTHLI